MPEPIAILCKFYSPPICGESAIGLCGARWYYPWDYPPHVYEGKALVFAGRLVLNDMPGMVFRGQVQPQDWPLEVLLEVAALLPDVEE